MALISRLKLWLTSIAAVIAGLLLVYLKGRKDADDANSIQEFNEYVSTRKRMDEADAPSDSDVQRWLLERSKQ